MQILDKKWFANGAIAKLLNNTSLLGRNAAGTADISIVKVNASDRVEFPSVPQCATGPSTGNDLVNKTYADGLSSGANTALSNLASTAVNTDVSLGTDQAFSLGSTTKRWLALFAIHIRDSANVIVLDVSARLLKNSSAVTLLDFSGTNAQTAVAPTTGNDICNKTYVDSVASAQKTWGYESLTLTGTDITNQYKDLAQVAVTGSIFFYVNGIWQRPTTDYTINYTGGTGGKSRLTFAGDLATAGAAALVSTDVINIMYQY